MSAETRFRVKPTFPLDAELIRRYRWRRIWRSPLTWGVLAGMALLGLMRGLSPVFAAFSAAGIGGLLSYWKLRSEKLEVDAIQEIIFESNRRQDAELQRIVDVLEANGHRQYALSLGKFLLLKQHIEESLHTAGTLTKQKQEIEVLVDALCHHACNQFTELTQLNEHLASVLTSNDPQQLELLKQRVDESHKRLMKAYGVMYQTAENLGTMLQPGSAMRDELQSEAQVMDRLIEQLQEEHDVAQRVHERLKDIQT